MKKMYSNNKSGTTGVSWDKDYKQWVAYASLGLGRQKKIGRFDTVEEAVEAKEAYDA